MEQAILKAIELYLNEPQDGSTYYIRAIPDPENLISFIVEELKKPHVAH